MCMIEGCDDRASVWQETRQRAKKEYKCCECDRAIAIGEHYWRLFAVGSDGPFTGKWCEHCNVAKEWLWKECGGSLLSGVGEDIHEHLEEYRGQPLRRLKILDIGMDRQWRIERGPRAGQLMPLPKMPPLFDAHHQE